MTESATAPTRERAGLPMIETDAADRSPEQIVQATVDSLGAAGLVPVEEAPNVNVSK